MPGPTITNKSPDPSVTVQTDTPLGFDVTDASAGFRAIVIVAKFAQLAAGAVPPIPYDPKTKALQPLWECVWDGTSFGPNYSTLSNVVSIANGFRFRIRRDGGWPSTPTLDVVAVDTAGAMA